MKYMWTTLSVCDMEKSIQFFEEVVRLTVVRKITTPQNVTEIAFLGFGNDNETLVELHRSAEVIDYKKELSIGFLIDKLNEKKDELAKKEAYIISEVIAPNPYTKFFFVDGPSNVRVQFVQQG